MTKPTGLKPRFIKFVKNDKNDDNQIIYDLHEWNLNHDEDHKYHSHLSVTNRWRKKE